MKFRRAGAILDQVKRFVVLLLWCAAAGASDWPQLLGPARNGVSPETQVPAAWPREGPRVVWKKNAGAGWSGPVVASNRVVLFHRVGGDETVEALDARSGAPVWKAAYPSTYRDDYGFEEGPRATPAVDGARIFTLGADGMLNCWNLNDGSNFWCIDTRKQFGNHKGFFGIACSPLVEGNALVVNVGGRDGAGIVAFDKATGAVLWKSTGDEASYSSPVAATFDGKRRLLVLTRASLVAAEPGTGKVLWQFPFRPRIQASVTAATPLVVGDLIFISASYGAGAFTLRFNETKPAILWNGDDILSNHYATSVHHNGFLFGFDGRQEQRCHLRCVELETGKVRWSENRFGAGALIVAGGKLLILTENGELIVAPASPTKFQPEQRAQILGSDCRSYPALANGHFYARDKRSLICVALRAGP